jgi:multimeric flavodoxin WrbA
MALKTFAAQHGMLWVGLDSDAPNRMGSRSGLIAQSEGASADVLGEDLETARYLGKRVARLATLRNSRL